MLNVEPNIIKIDSQMPEFDFLKLRIFLQIKKSYVNIKEYNFLV